MNVILETQRIASGFEMVMVLVLVLEWDCNNCRVAVLMRYGTPAIQRQYQLFDPFQIKVLAVIELL